MLYGHVIFSAEAQAIFKEYKRSFCESEPHIIFTKALTTDVAFYVLQNPVRGIITEESSFATHGANILRCYYNQLGFEIAWISGVKREDIERYLGKEIFISRNGEIGEITDEYCVSSISINTGKFEKVSYVPLDRRSILEYNISLKKFAICYWPHRTYNVLTFSVMKEGLNKNLHFLGYTKASIDLDKEGHIWLQNAPLVSELSAIAMDYDRALPLLLKQIDTYKEIYNRLQYPTSFSDLIEMLIDYFSVFLLFHDTYEDVLVEINLFLKNNFKESTVYHLMNVFMTCKVDEWMLNNNILLEKRKNLLSNEQVVPLPHFSIMDDIEYSRLRFSNLLLDLGGERFWLSNKNRLIFYIKFFVVKEWKFVMNKILFTRFSDYIRKIFPDVAFKDIA